MSDHHDDWFQHSPDGAAQAESQGDLNSGLIIVFLVIVAIGVLVIAILIAQYFKMRVADISEDRQEHRADTTTALVVFEAKATWEKKLQSDASWIDRDKGTVSIPLDIAMQRVVEEYAAR